LDVLGDAEIVDGQTQRADLELAVEDGGDVVALDS